MGFKGSGLEGRRAMSGVLALRGWGLQHQALARTD